MLYMLACQSTESMPKIGTVVLVISAIISIAAAGGDKVSISSNLITIGL
jgi:hypothetical protein